MNSTPHLSTAGWRPSCLRVVAALCLCACPPPSLTASVPDFDPATATFDELFFNVQRYATTPERRERKELSRQELKARGADSLSFYVEHAGVDNSWYFMLADEEVSLLPPEVGVPVLLRELDSRQPKAAETAAFFLGRYDRPEYAARLLPLLDNEDTAGVAVRTLGHWKIRNAVPLIAGYLHHPKERRRIGAANALRHIADPRAAPSLIEALGDPVFTVRKAAARALVAIGKESEAPILKAFPGAARTPQREMMSVLGALGSKAGARLMRPLLASNDVAVRDDAARALAWADATQPEMQVGPDGIQLGTPSQVAPPPPDSAPILTASAQVTMRPPAFYLTIESGKAYGPFVFQEQARVGEGKSLYEIQQIRDASFLLRSVTTSSSYGPFVFEDGAKVEVGSGAFTVQRVPPSILGTLQHPGLPPGGPQVRLIKITPTVNRKLISVRQTFREIDQTLRADIQPLRVQSPTISGVPGYDRLQAIERSPTDIARLRLSAQNQAARVLESFAEDYRLAKSKLTAEHVFEFAHLSPGSYYVCAQASVRYTGERARLATKTVIWWAEVQLGDGSAEIQFNEANARDWSELFPE